MANSFKKSTFKELWTKEYDVLNETSLHQFREPLDVNQWIIEDWQLVTGQFVPRRASFGASFVLSDDDNYNKNVYKVIKTQKMKTICVNDMVSNSNYERVKKELIDAFEAILPNRCSFEK